ncbi:MAG: hypothetical protein LBP92_00405 [Deltaproteobacteria bacterium]|nr:hypothetical protein [Deltaproteobacteria bacterium]
MTVRPHRPRAALLAPLVMLALLALQPGCSGQAGPAPDAAGPYPPVPGGVAGELKPAGEDEFLRGDYKAARPLLVNAGRGGSLRAVFFLRIISERGLDGQAPNPDEAGRLVALLAAMRGRLEELADRGPAADRPIYQASLALVFLRGQTDGGQDLARALGLARQAASGGLVPAMNLAAAVLLTPGAEAGLLKDLWGGGRSEAFALSLRAAKAGDALAMANVGYLFRTGTGTAQDLFQGASWARKAAALPQTTARAMNDLGAIYEAGGAVTPDKAEAARWYGLAAARGYPGAAASQARARSGKAGTPAVLDGLEY